MLCLYARLAWVSVYLLGLCGSASHCRFKVSLFIQVTVHTDIAQCTKCFDLKGAGRTVALHVTECGQSRAFRKLFC